MRVFAAVRPPEPVLEHLAGALVAVGVGGSVRTDAVRWTDPENWHLTLAFYGDVPDGSVAEVDAGLAEAARSSSPFEVRLRGAGVFAHRTLWVGLAGAVDRMVALGADARDAGEGVVRWEDDRVRSRPHLTVARATPSARRRDPRGRRAAEDPLAAPVHALSLYEGPTWSVDEVRLVRSEPGRGRGGGPLYTDLARHPLGAVAA
ncbi:RNA 2',3'-cyclic phosphodiesterase [Actinotalea sp. AC32]|nr:RNA 2',3'-cyclic phosphodiesterase [Actinotalea sp. AC32]